MYVRLNPIVQILLYIQVSQDKLELFFGSIRVKEDYDDLTASFYRLIEN